MRSLILDAELPIDSINDHINLHEVNHDILQSWHACVFFDLVELNICIFDDLELINFIVSGYEPIGVDLMVVDPLRFIFILNILFFEKED
jgi:hypothetical protein